MKYFYFISFSCQKYFIPANGNITFDIDKKIRTGEDVKRVKKHIEENLNVKNVTILNIVLLDNE